MDRQDLTLISLWIHVPFIIAWIGLIMFDFLAAFAPGLTTEQRQRMIGWSRPFVIVGIPVIMATGIWQTMDNPFFRVDSYSDLSRLKERTLYGDLLFWKHVFVVATFGLTILVRFILAPRMVVAAVTAGGGSTAMPDDSNFRLLRLATLANLAACLGAIMLATRMVIELH